MSEILELLGNELNLIEDMEIKNFTKDVLRKTSLEYWKRPSSMHKHHPRDEQGDFGNLIHVKRVVVIAKDLAIAENLPQTDCDVLISAMILHDICKYGIDSKSEVTVKDHPKLVEEFIGKNKNPHYFRILKIIKSHMGRWGEDIPITTMEIIGHYADYIASRPYMMGLQVEKRIVKCQ